MIAVMPTRASLGFFQFDAVAIDQHGATRRFRGENIRPPPDALLQRATTRHVDTVYIDGDSVYAQGRFKYIDRDKVLADIAEQLSRPGSGRCLECKRLVQTDRCQIAAVAGLGGVFRESVWYPSAAAARAGAPACRSEPRHVRTAGETAPRKNTGRPSRRHSPHA